MICLNNGNPKYGGHLPIAFSLFQYPALTSATSLQSRKNSYFYPFILSYLLSSLFFYNLFIIIFFISHHRHPSLSWYFSSLFSSSPFSSILSLLYLSFFLQFTFFNITLFISVIPFTLITKIKPLTFYTLSLFLSLPPPFLPPLIPSLFPSPSPPPHPNHPHSPTRN